MKPDILASIQRAGTTAKCTMYEKMTAFEYLNAEHTVQRTEFANGVSVTVNFSDDTYDDIAPGGFHIEQPQQ